MSATTKTTYVTLRSLEDLESFEKKNPKLPSSLIIRIQPSANPYSNTSDRIFEVSVQDENVPDTLGTTFILNYQNQIPNLERLAFIYQDDQSLYGYAVLCFERSMVWISGDRIYIPGTVDALMEATGLNTIYVPISRERTLEGTLPAIPGVFGTRALELYPISELPTEPYGPHPIGLWLDGWDYNIIFYNLGQSYNQPLLLQNGEISTPRILMRQGQTLDQIITQRKSEMNAEDIVCLKSPLTSAKLSRMT